MKVNSKGVYFSVFSQDIRIEFSIKKCGVIIMNKKLTDGIELPSREKISEIKEDGYKCQGILEYDRIKEQKNKR